MSLVKKLFTEELRCKLACGRLQDIADKQDGVLLNGNISKVAKDAELKVKTLKQYIKDNNITFKKGDN